MSLAYYDQDHELFGEGGVLRTSHDGHLGGSYEVLIYVRNDDSSNYYTNIRIVPEIQTEGWNPWIDIGWTIKLMNGSRRPTEAEWDDVLGGDTLILPDLGDTGAGDTSTYLPVWVRVFCPGGEPAQHKDFRLALGFYSRKVGS